MSPGDFSQLKMRCGNWWRPGTHWRLSCRWSAPSIRAHREPSAALWTPNTHRWWAPLYRLTSVHLFRSGELRNKNGDMMRTGFFILFFMIASVFSLSRTGSPSAPIWSGKTSALLLALRPPPPCARRPPPPAPCHPPRRTCAPAAGWRSWTDTCWRWAGDLLYCNSRLIKKKKSVKSCMKIDRQQPVCKVQTEAKCACLLWSYWECNRRAVCLFWCAGVKRKSQHLNAPIVLDDGTLNTQTAERQREKQI